MQLELIKKMKEHGINAYIIPSNDEFNNEYVPNELQRLYKVTGFNGSNGVAVISNDKKALYTDGRYLLQAKEQLGEAWEILDMQAKGNCSWFKQFKGKIIGYDPMLHSSNNIAYYKKLACKYDFTMQPLETNLVDEISPPKEAEIRPAYILEQKYSGSSQEQKLSQLVMDENQIMVITDLPTICWLFNIRGWDITFSPLLLGYLILRGSGSHLLYINPKKMENVELDGVEVRDIKQVKSDFLGFVQEGKKVIFDKGQVPNWFEDHSIDGQFEERENPFMMTKACKNETEQQGFRDCHIQDGKAVNKFIGWLKSEYENGQCYDELEAANKLLEFRQNEIGNCKFMGESFNTISGFGSNGAIIHYAANKESAKKIDGSNLYLLDSGGQYLQGTTDVTRVIALGEPTDEQKKHYTLVLKGHIALARSKFPIGTTGGQLDTLARQFLWQAGLDYAHGTGHGVGHFLSVHEGPQRIGKGKSCHVELKPGMVVSNEPGVYIEGKHGIRIESLLLVVESKTKGCLEMETLTRVVLEDKLIENFMLTGKELMWLNRYGDKAEAI